MDVLFMLLRRCRPDKMTLGPGGVCSGRREGAAGWQGTKSGWCPAGRLQLVALPTPQRPICARALFRLRLTRSSSRPLNACARRVSSRNSALQHYHYSTSFFASHS